METKIEKQFASLELRTKFFDFHKRSKMTIQRTRGPVTFFLSRNSLKVRPEHENLSDAS